jgi:predicted transcriptional regulator
MKMLTASRQIAAIVSVYIPVAAAAELDALARERKLPLSRVAAEALCQYLDARAGREATEYRHDAAPRRR